MKAFVIGFPKSGTSTIRDACTASGLPVAHWKINKGFCGQLIYKRYLWGDDPLVDFSEYDVIAQADVCLPSKGINFWPNLDFGVLYTIRRFHPRCVFILNVRNPVRLVGSISRWGTLRRRLIQSDIVGLPRGYGAEDAHLINWINNHYAACRGAFSADEYFVEIDIEDPFARERLSEALGVDLLWWGVANKNDKGASETQQPTSRNEQRLQIRGMDTARSWL